MNAFYSFEYKHKEPLSFGCDFEKLNQLLNFDIEDSQNYEITMKIDEILQK